MATNGPNYNHHTLETIKKKQVTSAMIGSSLFFEKITTKFGSCTNTNGKRKEEARVEGNHVRKVVKPMEAKLKKEMVKNLNKKLKS